VVAVQGSELLPSAACIVNTKQTELTEKEKKTVGYWEGVHQEPCHSKKKGPQAFRLSPAEAVRRLASAAHVHQDEVQRKPHEGSHRPHSSRSHSRTCAYPGSLSSNRIHRCGVRTFAALRVRFGNSAGHSLPMLHMPPLTSPQTNVAPAISTKISSSIK
jgi:hypothetical protein